MRQARLPLAVAVVTAALLSLVSVSAYKNGAISNPTSYTVVATDSAALALAPGPGNAANQASVSARMLQIDFRKASGAATYSVQRNRTVTVQKPVGTATLNLTGDDMRMRQVFTVTNNSTDCHDVSVYVTSGGPSHLQGIYGRLSTDAFPGTQLATVNGAKNGAVAVKLGTTAPANQLLVDFWWQATTTAFANAGTFTVQVSGTKSATCP